MSLINMLKSNPLIWLIGLGLIMVVAIPKLMENLDPETLREVQQSQKEMHKNMAVRFSLSLHRPAERTDRGWD